MFQPVIYALEIEWPISYAKSKIFIPGTKHIEKNKLWVLKEQDGKLLEDYFSVDGQGWPTEEIPFVTGSAEPSGKAIREKTFRAKS